MKKKSLFEETVLGIYVLNTKKKFLVSFESFL